LLGTVLFIVLGYVVRTWSMGRDSRLNNAWSTKAGGGRDGRGYFHLGGDEKGLGLLGGSGAANGKAD